jgi:arsenate reductase-like glutaredoxin family protein
VVKELLNPKSTGFKEMKLVFDKIDDAEAARLIHEYPKIMRRPLLSDGEKLAVGFDPDQFAALLK